MTSFSEQKSGLTLRSTKFYIVYASYVFLSRDRNYVAENEVRFRANSLSALFRFCAIESGETIHITFMICTDYISDDNPS